MTTKADFLAAYRAELEAKYPWAKIPGKLDTYLANVALTLTGEVCTWTAEGDALRAAWAKLGGKGKPTIKALRSLS